MECRWQEKVAWKRTNLQWGKKQQRQPTLQKPHGGSPKQSTVAGSFVKSTSDCERYWKTWFWNAYDPSWMIWHRVPSSVLLAETCSLILPAHIGLFWYFHTPKSHTRLWHKIILFYWHLILCLPFYRQIPRGLILIRRLLLRGNWPLN